MIIIVDTPSLHTHTLALYHEMTAGNDTDLHRCLRETIEIQGEISTALQLQFLHVRANIPPQLHDKIAGTCLKAWLRIACVQFVVGLYLTVYKIHCLT
jgi:hypothetical protein